MSKFHVIHADALEALKGIPDNSLDSCVCDPPYGLSEHKPDQVRACMLAWLLGRPYVPGAKRGFMGKSWDAWVPGPEIWREVLRALKPGGHLVAFAGTRSMDLMCMAVRLAGFELRDSIGFAHDGAAAPVLAWSYGSGFPKSLDVSKAIDKRGGNAGLTAKIGAAIKLAREARGMSASECDRIFCGGTTNWSWFEGRPQGQRLPTHETFVKIATAWPELASFVDAVAEVEREVIGTKLVAPGVAFSSSRASRSSEGSAEIDITAPATDAARQWQGWGTALKPAWEPIILARKPLVGTVAANVLEFGTGALNIDGCRVSTDDGANRARPPRTPNAILDGGKGTNLTASEHNEAGRWPANLVHDGSDAVLQAFPAAPGAKADVTGDEPSEVTANAYNARGRVPFTRRGEASASRRYEENGGTNFAATPGERRAAADSAARFFYCAKASRKDREEGCENLPQMRGGNIASELGGGGGWKDDSDKNPNHPRANTHPTVKPTALMRWLVRLVTPPGGHVLDPFAGSGSTGKAALLEGFDVTLIEREADYLPIIRARCEHAQAQVQREAEAAEAARAAEAADAASQGDLFSGDEQDLPENIEPSVIAAVTASDAGVPRTEA